MVSTFRPQPAHVLSKVYRPESGWEEQGGVVRDLFLLLFGASIFTLLYALAKAISLNRRISGGIVKKSWQLLYYLIGLLVAAYLATILFPGLPEASRQLILGIILLAAAVFVVKVVDLLFKIITDVGL
jgi:hypothetical protein